jgi:hypothetical protein
MIWVFIALKTSDRMQNNILGNSTDRLPTWETDGRSAKDQVKGQSQVATNGLSVSRSLTIHFGVEVLSFKFRPIAFFRPFSLSLVTEGIQALSNLHVFKS